MYHVNDEVKIRYNETFNKTEETVNDDVQNIKEWLKTQSHLPEIMSDVKIRNMLNLSKFNIKKTKEQIENYYKVRSKYPELFDCSNPKLPNIQKAMKETNMANHPELLDRQYRVLFIRTKSPNTLNPKDIFLLYFSILEMRLQEDFMTNDVVIVDMANYTFKDLCKTSFSLLLNQIRVHKAVYSIRVKNVYMINSPTYVSVAVKLFQLVLPPKIFSRCEFHQNSEILKNVFPVNVLPRDYGGDGPSLDELDELMKVKFVEFQERFDLLDTLRIDESLRPNLD